jgi:A/G-specific adenine glycosylase
VTTRLTGDTTEIGTTGFAKQVADKIRPRIPLDRPGDFAQALMELGARVCLPGSAARCPICPLSRLCLAYRNGNPEDYPVRKATRIRKVEVRTALVVTAPDGILIRKRPERGLLAGLWEFPHVEGRLEEEDARKIAVSLGAAVTGLCALPGRKHVFTHLEWHLSGWLACATSCAVPSGWTLATAAELREKYPVPAAFVPWLDLLGDCGMMESTESDGRQNP